MEDNMSFQNILKDLESYLEYQMDEGVQAIEVSPDIVRDLEKLRSQNSGPLPVEGSGVEGSQVEGAKSVDDGLSGGLDMEKIAKAVVSCRKCSLHKTRTKAVPGQGSFNPEIVFVGEAPGADEDRQGLAFVGSAGKLLTKMIEAMGYTREEVFIGNILKCRPPDNRTPLPDEMETCLPYLKAQIALLKPKVIITLGATAVKGLLDVQTGITKLRGTWLSFEGIDLMPTYHPAYLLYQRNNSAKKQVWEDLQAVLKHLGREIPAR